MDLLIVGLDGLSTNMLERFEVDGGYLEQFFEQGVAGDLRSVDSPTTLPAWTSFATGKDPGTHGIYGMKRQESNYETGPAGQNTTDPAIYDLLDDAIFVNLPGSERRLATGKNTHVVSSFAAKDKHDAVPDELHSLDSFSEYRSSYDSELKTQQGKYVDHICDIADRRTRFALEAFEELDPGVGFVLFSATDWIGHFLTNASSEETRGEWYRQVAERCIEHTETLAQETCADNVVVMSDHGFEHKRKTLHLNDWLAESGYISESKSDASLVERSVVLTAKAIAKRSDGAYELIRRAYNRVIGTETVSGVREAAQTDIDYEQSRAWEVRYGNLFINDDRFESSMVDDPEELLRTLRNDLENLTDGDGDAVYREVLTKDDAYENPSIELLPDLVARPAPGFHPTLFSSPTGGVTSPTDNFDHRYRGIFVAEGPMFETPGEVTGMSIIDVLPTLLYALAEGIPSDVDGEVRQDIVTGSYGPEELDPHTIEVSLKQKDEAREQAAEERLQDLGYLK